MFYASQKRDLHLPTHSFLIEIDTNIRSYAFGAVHNRALLQANINPGQNITSSLIYA